MLNSALFDIEKSVTIELREGFAAKDDYRNIALATNIDNIEYPLLVISTYKNKETEIWDEPTVFILRGKLEEYDLEILKKVFDLGIAKIKDLIVSNKLQKEILAEIAILAKELS